MSDNLYDRNAYINFGDSGNDPLSDKLVNKLQSVPYLKPHLVQKCDEFRPDKLAAKWFGDSALYWVVLEYNNLRSFTDVASGMTLLQPDIQALNNLLLSCRTQQTTTKTLYIK